MSRQLSEKQVLEMLGIPDFRHLSKDRMMAVLKMKSDKDTETKRFKFAVIGAVAVLGCFLTGAVLAALGGSSQISTGEDDDPSEE